MGTHWSPHDKLAQEKHSRGKVRAELAVARRKHEDAGTGESSAVEIGPQSVLRTV